MTSLDTTSSFSATVDARVSGPRLRHRQRASLRPALTRLRAIALPAIALAFAACQDAPLPLAPEAAALGRGGKNAELIYFDGSDGGNQDIYLMNADGSNVRRLTTDARADQDPDVAPSNRKIVWVRLNPNLSAELWTANADGSKATQLTRFNDLTYTYVQSPQFSPDGTKIVFSLALPGRIANDIYTINVDGTGLTRLTTSEADDRSPSWSPDGMKIVFASDRLAANVFSIWMMNADGTGDPVPVIQCDVAPGCGTPAWSPDRTQIAFADYAMNRVARLVLGGGAHFVGPDAPGTTHLPAWSKDGSRILFSSSRGGSYDIWSIAADDVVGTTLVQLTSSPGVEQSPASSH